LLESERASYEQVFGKIGSSYQFLQLVMTDPWFAWLRPVSQLIVAMDELVEAKEPLTAAGVEALVAGAKTLAGPDVGRRRLFPALRRGVATGPGRGVCSCGRRKLIRAQASGVGVIKWKS